MCLKKSHNCVTRNENTALFGRLFFSLCLVGIGTLDLWGFVYYTKNYLVKVAFAPEYKPDAVRPAISPKIVLSGFTPSVKKNKHKPMAIDTIGAYFVGKPSIFNAEVKPIIRPSPIAADVLSITLLYHKNKKPPC